MNGRSKKSNFSNLKHKTSQILVQLIWETPNSYSSSWMAHRLFVVIAVYCCRQGRKASGDHRFSQLVTLSATLRWVKVKLDIAELLNFLQMQQRKLALLYDLWNVHQ